MTIRVGLRHFPRILKPPIFVCAWADYMNNNDYAVDNWTLTKSVGGVADERDDDYQYFSQIQNEWAKFLHSFCATNLGYIFDFEWRATCLASGQNCKLRFYICEAAQGTGWTNAFAVLMFNLYYGEFRYVNSAGAEVKIQDFVIGTDYLLKIRYNCLTNKVSYYIQGTEVVSEVDPSYGNVPKTAIDTIVHFNNFGAGPGTARAQISHFVGGRV